MVYNFTSREKNILHYLSISETYIWENSWLP